MSIVGIIPVKELALGKSRLSKILSQKQRMHLISILIENTILELKKCNEISSILVISNDLHVIKLVYKYQIPIIQDNGSGVSDAIKLADDYCLKHNFKNNIVIPCDLPLINFNDLDAICNISKKYNECLIMCPSLRYDGTNILLRKPINYITQTFYDNNSFQMHKNYAKELSVPVKILRTQNLMIDLDTKEDIDYLLINSPNNIISKYLKTLV